jgi:hypothetical protein
MKTPSCRNLCLAVASLCSRLTDWVRVRSTLILVPAGFPTGVIIGDIASISEATSGQPILFQHRGEG